MAEADKNGTIIRPLILEVDPLPQLPPKGLTPGKVRQILLILSVCSVILIAVVCISVTCLIVSAFLTADDENGQRIHNVKIPGTRTDNLSELSALMSKAKDMIQRYNQIQKSKKEKLPSVVGESVAVEEDGYE